MSKSRNIFYLLGRWILVLVVLSSIIFVPISFEWFKVYSSSDGFIKKRVLIDSLSVVADEAGPLVTAYSKDLHYKRVNINNSDLFLSKKDSIHFVWDNPEHNVAYLIENNEKSFPKKKILNKLILFHSILIVSIIWGIFGFSNYFNKKN